MSNFHQQAIAIPEPEPPKEFIAPSFLFFSSPTWLLTKEENEFFTIMVYPRGIREALWYGGGRGIDPQADYDIDVLMYLLAEILWRSPKNRKYVKSVVRKEKRERNKILKKPNIFAPLKKQIKV